MLSAITLGLRGLQMILTIAFLGLALTLLLHLECDPGTHKCLKGLEWAFDKDHTPRTVHYSIFLGVYGMVISAVGTVALFIERISINVPLVGDIFGALFFLAAGVAWMISIMGNTRTCSQWENINSNDIDWYITVPIWKYYQDAFDKLAAFFGRAAANACRQGHAEHGLAWTLFTFTTCLVICDYLRRRDLVKSSK